MYSYSKEMSVTQTGQRRFRMVKYWRKPPLLVLQLEWRTIGAEISLPSEYSTPYEKTEWRDARVEDLTVEETCI